MKQFNLTMTDELHESFKIKSIKDKRSMRGILNDYVISYLREGK